jgi:hypothetical protein
VDDIMDEVQEEQELMNQISEAISRPAEDMYDEEELMAELEGLEDELEAELSAASAAPAKPVQAAPQQTAAPAQSVFNFPQVPVNQPVRPLSPSLPVHCNPPPPASTDLSTRNRRRSRSARASGEHDGLTTLLSVPVLDCERSDPTVGVT